jgi:hypothetical protein
MSKITESLPDHQLLPYIVRDPETELIGRFRFFADALETAIKYGPGSAIRIGGKTIWTIRANEKLCNDEISVAATRFTPVRLAYKNQKVS